VYKFSHFLLTFASILCLSSSVDTIPYASLDIRFV